jgi:tRNA threonylcarbamoyladenosine biosynthesis protein TsaB
LNRQASGRAGETAPDAIVFTGELASLEGKWDPAAASSCGVPLLTRPMPLQAGAVGLLAERRYVRGERDDVHGFVPNYTQLTEAEVNLAKSRTGSAT